MALLSGYNSTSEFFIYLMKTARYTYGVARSLNSRIELLKKNGWSDEDISSMNYSDVVEKYLTDNNLVIKYCSIGKWRTSVKRYQEWLEFKKGDICE